MKLESNFITALMKFWSVSHDFWSMAQKLEVLCSQKKKTPISVAFLDRDDVVRESWTLNMFQWHQKSEILARGTAKFRATTTLKCNFTAWLCQSPQNRRLSSVVSWAPCFVLLTQCASRAEGPGFESRLRRDFFGVELYQWLKNWHSSGYPARRLAL